MKTTEFVQQAEDEVKELTRNLDDLVDEYLTSSTMSKAQRIVNVGRALNAFHVAWIANLGAELETRHKHLINEGIRSVPSFKESKKEFNL